MQESDIRYMSFPRTEPPPEFAGKVVEVFKAHESEISTILHVKGLKSDMVLAKLRPDLVDIGFEVEEGKHKSEKIDRPVFYGENGMPTLRYQIDAYNPGWECGLEIEAGRAWMGNAVYRDIVQACVMVQVKYLILAVPNEYTYSNSGKSVTSKDYAKTAAMLEALYGHSRLRLPYDLVLIGY